MFPEQFGEGGKGEEIEPEIRKAMPAPDVQMVGLGMLLKEKWVVKHTNLSNKTLSISDVFAGIERKEKVWSVHALAPGFGAADSGKVHAEDIVIRIDGEYITGAPLLDLLPAELC